MKHLYVLFVVFILTACNQKKKVSGLWVYSYELYEDGRISFPSTPVNIFEFRKDTIIETVIGNKVNGIKNHQNVFDIKRNADSFIFGDEYILNLDSVKGDSLLLLKDDLIVNSFNTDDKKVLINGSIVCKRLPANQKIVKWNPLNKTYRFKNWKSESITMEFISDSTFIEYDEHANAQLRKWESFHVKNYQILLFTYIDPTPIFIDSIIKDKVYATYFGPKVNKFVFEEIKKD